MTRTLLYRHNSPAVKSRRSTTRSFAVRSQENEEISGLRLLDILRTVSAWRSMECSDRKRTRAIEFLNDSEEPLLPKHCCIRAAHIKSGFISSFWATPWWAIRLTVTAKTTGSRNLPTTPRRAKCCTLTIWHSCILGPD